MDSDLSNADICRVCRSEGMPDRPLFHPCICTGSIKWIHQECLMQWMRYSRKEYCELCSYRFSFTPIYSPDMPRRLPLRDLAAGLFSSILRALKYWIHYTVVALAWLGLVPLTACRIYRALFSSWDAILLLPFDIFSTENVAMDIFHGCFVVMSSLFAFAGLVWLREQILHGGGPDWFQRENEEQPADAVAADVQPMAAPAPADPAVAGDAVAPVDGAFDLPPPPQQQPRVPPNFALQDNAEAAEIVDEQGGEENNWMPMEWDRAAEEITWERLLGLDGSLMFLEHVFWVISLNTVFVLIFAFVPYHVGKIAVHVMDIRALMPPATAIKAAAISSAMVSYANESLVGSATVLREGDEAWSSITKASSISLNETVSGSASGVVVPPTVHFTGLLTTLIGYCVVGMAAIVLHRLSFAFRLDRAQRVFGMSYVVIKVALLSIVEIGFLPLVCGWWLDICSMPMFDVTMRERRRNFHAAPGTSLFLHWLVGMVYVYYFASFVLLVREIVRPGVLWFLRNLNDPEFSPIQEMIQLSLLEHLRKLLVSALMFGLTVLLMLYVPIRMVRHLWPSFLPYAVTMSTMTDIHQQHQQQLNQQQQHYHGHQGKPVAEPGVVNELSLELLLLQVIVPALLQQSHARVWLKWALRGWCKIMACLLGLNSYLMGNAQSGARAAPNAQPAGADQNEANEGGANQGGGGADGGLRAVHHALLMVEPPTGFEPYDRPRWFAARVVILLVAVAISLCLASLTLMTAPVAIGRHLMYFWMSMNGVHPTHELYTAALGLYACWMTVRVTCFLGNWLPQGRRVFLDKLCVWASTALRAIAIGIMVVGLVPLMFGIVVEVMVVVPFRVPLHKTPLYFLWQDWVLGILYTKIACAVAMMGPEWFLRTNLEQMYREGGRRLDVWFVARGLVAPIVCALGLILAVPYVLVEGLAPMFVRSMQMRNLIRRRFYPMLWFIVLVVALIMMQVRQFRKLYEHIKNDKYLVGQRLVNYEHERNAAQSELTSGANRTTN